MHNVAQWAAGAALVLVSSSATAAVTTEMHKIDETGVGAAIGTVTAEDSAAGLILTPDLKDLPPGPRGFHVHEKPDCGPGEKDGKPGAGLAAGSHYDPQNTGKHLGPMGEGHLGDLPRLDVAADGTAKTPVTAPRLKLSDITGRSLMIHAEDDNYGDKPGGARIACGVVK